jgi:hypothetical protein
MEGGPDSRQRRDEPETGLLSNTDPAGPHRPRRERRGPAAARTARPYSPGTSCRTGPQLVRPSGRGRTMPSRIASDVGVVRGHGQSRDGGSPPFWRGKGIGDRIRRSARPVRRPLRRGWRGRRSTSRSTQVKVVCRIQWVLICCVRT